LSYERKERHDLCEGAAVGGEPGLDARSVLFADLVGSTEVRSPLGDSAEDVEAGNGEAGAT
jgi:hypothetical protein